MRKLILTVLLSMFTLTLLAPNLSEKMIVDRNSLILAKLREQAIENRILEIKESEDFSKKLLIEYIQLVDPTLSDIPIRQFILETGWFKSTLFTKHNNLAGMKLPRIRQTTAVGQALGHAVYKHWTDSVDDYVHWKNYWKSRGYNTKNYYAFLKNVGYATFEGYERRLKSIKLKC